MNLIRAIYFNAVIAWNRRDYRRHTRLSDSHDAMALVSRMRVEVYEQKLRALFPQPPKE